MPGTLTMSPETATALHYAELDFIDIDAKLRSLAGRLNGLAANEAKQALDALAMAKLGLWEAYCSLRDQMAMATEVYEQANPIPF